MTRKILILIGTKLLLALTVRKSLAEKKAVESYLNMIDGWQADVFANNLYLIINMVLRSEYKPVFKADIQAFFFKKFQDLSFHTWDNKNAILNVYNSPLGMYCLNNKLENSNVDNVLIGMNSSKNLEVFLLRFA